MVATEFPCDANDIASLTEVLDANTVPLSGSTTNCLLVQSGNPGGIYGEMATTQTEFHIPLMLCWEVIKRTMSLTTFELEHLLDCDECIRTLGICQIAKSVEHAHLIFQEEFER